MNQSVYSAGRAITAQQQRLDVIANNLANVNTTGFKNTRVDFKDSLYQNINGMQPAAEGIVERGHGTQVSNTRQSFEQGNVIYTDEPLDVALNGYGFFVIEDSDGVQKYTRDGHFALSVETDADGNTHNMLVNGAGNYVLDENGQHIEILGKASELRINTDGTLRYSRDVYLPKKDEDGNIISRAVDVPEVKIGTVDFMNPDGLEEAGKNLFTQTQASGGPSPTTALEFRQSALEGSNVDLPTEMTRLIRTQRALQLAARALSTADEMDAQVSQLRN